MHVEPSGVAGVELIGPDAPTFRQCIETLAAGELMDAIEAALPYSVIVRNSGERALVLLGIRFDMVSRQNHPYSVVHYADTLRYPEKPSLAPGAMRFICAEPRYTDMVLRRESTADRRGAMNLQNLSTAVRVAASLDCVAFCDGQFAGPDSHGAFERFQRERELEAALLQDVTAEMQRTPSRVGELLTRAVGISDTTPASQRALAKRLHAAFYEGGADELTTCVRNHRIRMNIWRS